MVFPYLHVPAAKAVACTRVGGSVEPHSRAACARAARARSGDPLAPGKVQEKVRRRHQPWQRTDGACWTTGFSVVPGPRAAIGREDEKLLGVVEVETAESLNNLEAMSQWATFAKLRVPFHLYVPASGIDSARRLCSDFQIQAAEMWAYHSIGDQIRFTLVSRTEGPQRPREAAPARPAATPVAVARPKAVRAAAPRTRRASATTAAKPRPVVAKKKAPDVRRAAKRPAARQSAPSRAQKRK